MRTGFLPKAIALTFLSSFLWGEEASAQTELAFSEVLGSVESYHPLIQSELANVDAAEGEVLAARGEFDTQLTVQGRVAPAGYYDPKRIDVVLEQPTPILGASLYAGYRVTRGNVAPYYGEQRTLDNGEVRSGLRVPLWQDRAIDARRAGRESARAMRNASERGYDKIKLDMQRDAALAYYNWVAAGRRLDIVTKLIALAEFRDAQIAQKVELGALPSIEHLDNQRSILERKRQLVSTRRAFEKASLDLSLFLRNQDGSPRVPSEGELPKELSVELPPTADRNEAIERALSQRPELEQQEALINAARVDASVAQNRVAPRLDAFGEVSKDLGDAPDDIAPTLRPTVVEVGVTLSVPLYLRKARGKRDSAEAKLRATEQKATFARDKVKNEVLDAWSQLEAARERVQVSSLAADAALRVADGERERFELGATTVLFVNLREQTAADAQIAMIDALAEAKFAQARLTLAMGEPLRN